MSLLSTEEFNQRSSSGANPLEKIYQGKAVEAGPVFSLDNLQAAELYCQRFSRKQTGAVCVIVQEQSFFKIWSEIIQNRQNAVSELASSSDKVKNSLNSLPVTDEFIDYCQKLLAEYIGPIAKMLCKKTLAKRPHLNRTEFVTTLAKKIADPNQAQEFKKSALE